MVAEIISVGTELLLGNIVNINAQYLAGRLAELGFDLYYQTVVGDNTAHLKAALDVAYSRAELVILTGGLGPTKDDMTKEMLVSYFGKKLTFDPRSLPERRQASTCLRRHRDHGKPQKAGHGAQ